MFIILILIFVFLFLLFKIYFLTDKKVLGNVTQHGSTDLVITIFMSLSKIYLVVDLYVYHTHFDFCFFLIFKIYFLTDKKVLWNVTQHGSTDLVITIFINVYVNIVIYNPNK
jgi:hypothetical protein